LVFRRSRVEAKGRKRQAEKKEEQIIVEALED